MVKRKNTMFRQSKHIKQRYATRKLKVGMVSLLMGFTFVFGSGRVSQMPALISNAQENANVQENAKDDSQKESDYKEEAYVYEWHPGSTNIYKYLEPNKKDESNKTVDNVKADANASVKVTTGDINDKGEQEWTLVFNENGLYHHKEGNNNDRTAPNATLGFALSKNLEIISQKDKKVEEKISVTIGNNKTFYLDSEKNYGSEYFGKNNSINYFNFDKKPENNGSNNENKNNDSNNENKIGSKFELKDFNVESYKDVNDKIESIKKDSYKLYYFEIKKDAPKIIIKFTTRDKSYIRKGYYSNWIFGKDDDGKTDGTDVSRVTALYYAKIGLIGSTVNLLNHTFIRVDSLSKPLKYDVDSDGDGLPDKYENFLGTDPKKTDTDGDKKLDGNEVRNYKEYPNTIPTTGNGIVASHWKDYPAVYILNGTNPLVGIPTVPTKIIGKVGEVVEGQTAPWTVVSLKVVDKNNGDSVTSKPIGEAISDKNGHYRIEIGKILKRGESINIFGNKIVLGNQDKIDSTLDSDLNSVLNHPWEPAHNEELKPYYNEENKIYGGDNCAFRLEALSNGFDSNIQYDTPEVSSKVEKVDDFTAKYGEVKVEPTLVINKDKLSQSEKDAIKTKVVDIIKDGNHDDLIRNLASADYFAEDLKSIDVASNVDVSDNGTVTIKIKGINMNYTIAPENTVIAALKPEFKQNETANKALGIDNNDLVISNVDPKATSIVINDTTHNEPLMTLTKNGDTWTSGNQDLATVKVVKEAQKKTIEHTVAKENQKEEISLYIIPTTKGMDKLEKDSSVANNKGEKGIKAVVTLDKQTDPKTMETGLIDYTTNRPVSSAPTLANINMYTPNIVISDIPVKANKLTLTLSKKGEENKTVDLTLSKENGKSVWNVGNNFDEVFGNSKKTLEVEGGNLTITNYNKDALQGWSIKVLATNTNYNGSENNLTESNTVVYDTKIDTPTYKTIPGYGDNKVVVNIPADASIGDKLTLDINGIATTYTLTDKEIKAKEITFTLAKELVTGDIVKLSAEDTHGNKAAAEPVTIPEAQNSVAVTDAKQTRKDTIEAKVAKYEGEANAYVALSDGSILNSIKVTIGEPNEDGIRTLTATIPDGYNGRELKFVFAQKNHKASLSNNISIDQSIDQMRIEQAQVGSNTIKVIIPKDVKAGDKYTIKINGEEAASGTLADGDAGKDKVITLDNNKVIPNEATISTEVTDTLGNTATYSMTVSEEIDISFLEEAIKIAGPADKVEKSDKYTLTKNKYTLIKGIDPKKKITVTAAQLKEAYDNAINTATELLDKAKNSKTAVDISQAQINRAATNLLQAYNALNGTVDKKPLIALMKGAEKIKNTDNFKYADEDKKKALENAIKNAYDILSENEPTQADLTNAGAEIQKALDQLNGLNKVKDEAKNEVYKAVKDKKDKIDKDTSKTDKEKEDLKKKVDEEAKKTKDDIDKADTKEKVEEAKKQGITNIENVGKATPSKEKVNKDGLIASIEEGKKLAKDVKDNKTINQDLKDALNKAISDAEGVRDKEDATQEEVDNKKLELDKAIAKVEVDKKLQEKIKEIEGSGKNKEEEKNKEIEDAKKAAEDAKKAIDNSKTKDEVDKAKKDGITKIGNVGKDNTTSSSTKPSAGTSSGGTSPGGTSPGETSSGGTSSGETSSRGSYTENNTPTQTVTSERQSGKNRFETAANVAKQAYPNGAKTVVLVHADKFTDALAAIPYAKIIKAPILYVGTDKTPEETMKALKELKTENLIMIGGNNSISNYQKTTLDTLGYNTSRIGGRDRYETAQLIAEKLAKTSKLNSRDVIIASGEDFPDAITISSVAIKDETPILLSSKNIVSKYTIKGLEDLAKDRIILVGGLNSLSSNVESKVKPYTKQTITRFAGRDRYDTSAIIAKKFRPNATVAIFANGEKFQDAMVSGGLLNNYDAPLLLLRKDSVPKSVEEYIRNSKVKKSIIVGGENSVSKKVEDILKELENK